MFTRVVFIITLLCLLVAPAAQAAPPLPTIAVLTFGAQPYADTHTVQSAIFAVLAANGIISDSEVAELYANMPIENDNIVILRGDAGVDFAAANALVESMLDEGASVLVTLSTPMTLAALNVMQDMDDPPAILFAQAVNPYEAGIAAGACDKPDHITGIEAVVDYAYVLPIMQLQDPDLAHIGTLYNSSETSGRLGAEAIVAAAEAVGIAVETTAVTNVSELAAATEGLISRGVDALIVPWDVTTSSGLPIIAAAAQDNDVPLFYANSMGAFLGATVGVGQAQHINQGMHLGHILVAYLNGELDIADTAITALSESGISVNTTIPNIPIAPELVALAEFSVTESGRTVNPSMFMKRMLDLGIVPRDVIQAVAAAGADRGVADEDLGDTRLVFFGPMLTAAAKSEGGQAKAQAFLASLSCANM